MPGSRAASTMLQCVVANTCVSMAHGRSGCLSAGIEAQWPLPLTAASLKPIRSHAQPPAQQCCQKDQRHCPPEPTDAARPDFILGAKLLFDKLIVIKFLVRQAEPLRLSALGPASVLISAAFRARSGLGRHFRAAVRTNLRRGFQNAECGIRNAECLKFGMRSAECGSKRQSASRELW